MTEVSNPPPLWVLFETFKIIILRKILDIPLEKPLKLIRAICKKNGQVQDKIPHKSQFIEHYLSFIILLSQTWAFCFYSISIIFQSLTQTSVHHLFLRQICKIWNQSQICTYQLCIEFLDLHHGSPIWSIQYQEKS